MVNTNLFNYEMRALKAFEEQVRLEVRFNPYHDPRNGRFAPKNSSVDYDYLDSKPKFTNAADNIRLYSSGGENGVDKIKNIDYNKINEEIQYNNLINSNIGVAEKPQHVNIESYHKHALKRMKERNITKEEAQNYIDTSLIAFNQNTAEAYYSPNGVSAVRKSNNELITTFRENDFDESTKEIIKVANKYGL
jgi:hypothetical protein